MPSERVERKLAAILAADVAGYSRLMGADEEGTLARLKAHRRELIDPKIAEHRGRVVKTTGDGILIEFPSVVDAVRCAVEVQHGMANRNSDVPQERRIVFRVGINVGDIIVDGDDIHGDGVNIAARLEALCEPGGICISQTANDQIRDKLKFAFIDLGEQSFKNIARAVGTYALTAQDILQLSEEATGLQQPNGNSSIQGNRSTTVPAVFRAPAPPLSIAVMPFNTLSGDASQDYFADGLVDSLTTDLSLHVPNLFVIGRGSAFTYKGKAVNAKQGGHELGVRYLLQGSVQRGGNQVRVIAHLVDTETGAQCWTERFDGDSTDLLSLQDQIAARIANSLGVVLYLDSTRDIEKRSENPDAIDLVMRGWAAFFLGDRTMANFNAAEPYYRKALALDPANPDALIGLGAVLAGRLFNFGQYHATEQQLREEISEVRALLDRGLEKRPNSAAGHQAKGITFGLEQRFSEAFSEFEIAHSLDPSSPLFSLNLGNVLACLGKPEKALPVFEEAITRSPRDPSMGMLQSSLGRTYLLLGRWEEAIEANLKARAKIPSYLLVHTALAAAYAQIGDLKSAAASLKDARAIEPKLSFSWLKDHHYSTDPAYLRLAEKTLYDGLRKAGLPE